MSQFRLHTMHRAYMAYADNRWRIGFFLGFTAGVIVGVLTTMVLV